MLRRWGLALMALILPAATLVYLGMLTEEQERELAQNRARDDRERAGVHFGQELRRELERLAEQGGPELLASMTVDDAGLVLPWDPAPRPTPSQPTEFEIRLREAEGAEFRQGRPEAAAKAYAEALEEAVHPAAQALARLGLVRVLRRLQRADAADHARSLLALSPEVRDELGVPFAFYAIGSVSGSDRASICPTIHSALRSGSRLPPVALRMALGSLPPDGDDAIRSLRSQVEASIRLSEQLVKLASEFPSLRGGLFPLLDGESSRWGLYGDQRWLVGSNMANRLFVVDAEVLTRRVFDERGFSRLGYVALTLQAGSPNGQGAWLGSGFSGLRADFIPVPDHALSVNRLRRAFHWTLLASVLAVTLFTALLWWRDARRELRLSELRADFVASVSHELKTPLTSIRMYAETLRFRSPSEAQRSEYLDTILSESERLSRLLANVLDFSRMDRDARGYRPRPADLHEVVHSAVRAMRQPLAEQEFDLTVRLPDAPVTLCVDRDAIEQALVNLLSNAVKYSGDARSIQLLAAESGGGIALSIRDQGLGIHPREHRRIFEPYYRAQDAHNASVPGAGLGLSLVRHIAEGHGGHVSVASAPGEGSTFTLWLPHAALQREDGAS